MEIHVPSGLEPERLYQSSTIQTSTIFRSWEKQTKYILGNRFVKWAVFQNKKNAFLILS
jgi:uncharacterized protein YecA (UPF0149 family)